MNKRAFFNKRDIVVILVIFTLTAVIYTGYRVYMGNNAEYAEVLYNGNTIKKLPLNKDTVYIPDENKNIIIEIKNNKIHIKESDCPDKICVNTGWLSAPGQTAVCLPNKMSVVVKGKSSDVDTAL